MNTKTFILLIVLIAIVIILLFYFTNPKEVIKIESEEKIPSSEIDPNVVTAKSYYIDYEYGDLSEKYYIQEVLFQNSDVAENFVTNFMTKSKNLLTNKNSLKIGEFEGYSFDILGVESEKYVFGLLIRNRDVIIYGDGISKENLIKVTEWFTNR
jgi:hypothetical protein